MPVEIPDLWSDKIRVDVQTPLVILRAQDEAIGRKTQGTLRTEVATHNGPDMTTHVLDLHAPALGYREELLDVTHRAGKPYPATIVMAEKIQWSRQENYGLECRCLTPDEFIEELRVALQSEPVMSAILSILAKSNEVQEARK